MLRIIREVKPAYVIGENVAGLINMALDDVLASLEAEGYTTETFVVPACAVGAPHRRDRLWIVGYSQHNGQPAAEIGCSIRKGNDGSKAGKGKGKQLTGSGNSEPVATPNPNPNHQRCQECQPADKPEGTGRACGFDTPGGVAANAESQQNNRFGQGGLYSLAAGAGFRLTEPPVCSANDGISSGLVRNRSKQLKAYGNAIVPQVAYQIFQAIQIIHNDR